MPTVQIRTGRMSTKAETGLTTSAVDNIDVNPSSTTAKESFHRSGISLFQHPRQPDDGTNRGRIILGGASSTKSVRALRNYYSDVVIWRQV